MYRLNRFSDIDNCDLVIKYPRQVCCNLPVEYHRVVVKGFAHVVRKLEYFKCEKQFVE